MKGILALCALMLLSSCIPLRIAPDIQDHKVILAKKFKHKLPKQYAFIFEDHKDADAFYNFINTKYNLNSQDVDWNVPVFVDGRVYYLSFYEVEIPDKTLNLIPILIDGSLESNGWDPVLEDVYVTRTGNWYLALTVFDEVQKDGLKPGYEARDRVLQYLQALKFEYINGPAHQAQLNSTH